jgi:hypothetical protein
VPNLIGGDSYADAAGPTLASPAEERPVSTADVQQPLACLALHLVQQVIVLVGLGLLQRQFRIALVDALGQVQQAAGGKEPIDD